MTDTQPATNTNGSRSVPGRHSWTVRRTPGATSTRWRRCGILDEMGSGFDTLEAYQGEPGYTFIVSEKVSTHLPIFDEQPADESESSCSPKVYVSNEEKTILDAMRKLRDRAVELRQQLEVIKDADDRRRIESELAELRAERSDLAIRREQAFKRKMIMLGHLPPDDEVRLF